MQDLEHIAQNAHYRIRDSDGEHCGLSANEVYSHQIISSSRCTIKEHVPTFSERMIPWHDVIIWLGVALIIATILHHLIYKTWRTYQYEAETERMEMEKEHAVDKS